MLVTVNTFAEVVRTSDDVLFAEGINLLQHIKDTNSVKAAEEVFSEISSNYNCAQYFRMYAQAINDLNQKQYDTAETRLDLIGEDDSFIAYLKKYSLPSCEEICIYIRACRAEENENYEEAYQLFGQTDVFDSLDRLFNLKMQILNKEANSSSTLPATPTTTNTPESLIVTVYGDAMEPTLHNNDVVLVDTTAGLNRDDIIVCYYPNRGKDAIFINRIVGVPGDIVYRKNGVTHIKYDNLDQLIDEAL